MCGHIKGILVSKKMREHTKGMCEGVSGQVNNTGQRRHIDHLVSYFFRRRLCAVCAHSASACDASLLSTHKPIPVKYNPNTNCKS